MKTRYEEIIIPDIVAAEPQAAREKEHFPDEMPESSEEITEEELLDTVSRSCVEDEDLSESPSFCLS